MYIARFIFGIAACGAFSLLGCSSSSSPSSSTDAGGGGGGSSDTVNGCTAADFAANDLSAQSNARIVTFPTTAAPAQYQPACVTIAVGQSLTFNGSFTNHPLVQAGGDPSVFITSTSSGSTATFGFPVGGTYGFQCSNHPSVMKGAVFVR
jgi:plastocyanin